MNFTHLLTAQAFAVVTTLAASPALAANEAEMMSTCNLYAAHHLHLDPSQITEVTFQGRRTDGTYAVNGSTSEGQTFQCSFGIHGQRVVNWYHSAPTACPVDVSEADRWLYPACN
ncbi:MAG: hypothetical protein CMH12_18500 [Maritimibacter sp.]|nr:hypothetical protein [Maritimibacter sp.]